MALHLDAVATGPADAAGWPAARGWLWRLLSIAVVALAWELAGRVPISFAFPTFADTMLALGGLIVSGELPRAYLSTLQPLVIGVVDLGRGRGRRSAWPWACARGLEWLVAPLFTVLAGRADGGADPR